MQDKDEKKSESGFNIVPLDNLSGYYGMCGDM